MRARGTSEQIDELIACMKGAGRVPHFAHTGDFETAVLETQDDGKVLVEVSGEMPRDIQSDFNPSLMGDVVRISDGRYVDTKDLVSLARFCWDNEVEVEIVTEQTEEKPYYADLWYRAGKRDPVQVRIPIRENNWRAFAGDDAPRGRRHDTFPECAQEAGLPAATKEDDPFSPGFIGHVHWFNEIEGDYTSSFDDNNVYGNDGQRAGTPVRRPRGKMNIIIEDAIGEPEAEGGLAYVMEFNDYPARRPWKVANLIRSCENLTDAHKLRRVAIDWGEATKADRITEIVQIQTQGNVGVDRDREIVVESVIPTGRKQLWCHAYPIGNLFLNVEFAYEGNEPMEAHKLESEARRALKAVKKDSLIDDSKGIAFLRMSQRPARDAKDVGVHICCIEITNEFREEWGFLKPRYGHPRMVSTPGAMRR